jgi:SAM-dependent methyltransferase
MDHDEYVRKTSSHYSLQWGAEIDFAGFVAASPEAAKAMPARQLPWSAIIERIRDRAARQPVRVYDAGCGFGDILTGLFSAPIPSGLAYLGIDLHDALDTIPARPGATLRRGDITVPTGESFDFVLCRATIHHTPDPAATFRTLVSQLAPNGTIAISGYAKKAPMREAIDDALRQRITPLPAGEAFDVCGQFTKLGRDLQSADGKISIKEDLPMLGIQAGEYGIQDFLYRYFIKCWHNPSFSRRHCDLVNFDWYHPPYAYRFELAELAQWAQDAGLDILRTASTDAQHYVEAARNPR